MKKNQKIKLQKIKEELEQALKDDQLLLNSFLIKDNKYLSDYVCDLRALKIKIEYPLTFLTYKEVVAYIIMQIDFILSTNWFKKIGKQ